MFYSFKYTVRSLLRDIFRGWWGRCLVYPRLARNEFSLPELERYVNAQAVAAGVAARNPTAHHLVGNSHICISKDEIKGSLGAYLLPRSFSTLIRSRISTSGSTGRPLTIIQDIGAVIREEAFVYRQLRWAGYKHGKRRAWLRGDVVCGDQPRDDVYGCRDWWSNTLMLSSYHISSSTAQSYIDALGSFDPVLIQAYPSSIHALASWMLANNIRYSGHSIRAIVTSSETLEKDVQERIEQAFGCRVFDWYGQAERVAAIGTCEHGRHHVLTDYGMVELLPDSEGLYELVGTSYNNHAMRLAHYRTGDLVRISQEVCPCRRMFPVVETIIGRRDNVVILPDGRHIGRLDHVFKGMDSIIEGQVAYRGANRFVLRIVPSPSWLEADAQRLVRQFKERVTGVLVDIEILAAIPRGANGKFAFVRIEEEI